MSSPKPEFETLLVEHQDGIALITVNRPEALNALNNVVLRELHTAFEALAADHRVVILTGAGEKAFVAGADIAEMQGMSSAEAKAFSELGHRTMSRISNHDRPVLAAVNGFALGGGCELALSCDIIYAAEGAVFGQPEVKLGLIPGFGGSVRLARKIGPTAAAEWLFSGKTYDAATAKRLGLASDVYPSTGLLAGVKKMAKTIGWYGPVAVATCKRLLNASLDLPLRDALAAEAEAFGEIFDTHDAQEGTTAFLEKRKANYKGR